MTEQQALRIAGTPTRTAPPSETVEDACEKAGGVRVHFFEDVTTLLGFKTRHGGVAICIDTSGSVIGTNIFKY
jgi:hypothetical protein